MKCIKSGTESPLITAAKESNVNNSQSPEHPLPLPFPAVPGEWLRPSPLTYHCSSHSGGQPPDLLPPSNTCCSGRQRKALLVIPFTRTRLTTEGHHGDSPGHIIGLQKALTTTASVGKMQASKLTSPCQPLSPRRALSDPSSLSSPPALPTPNKT